MKKYNDVKSNIHYHKLCFDNANFFYYTERVEKEAIRFFFQTINYERR